MERVSALVLIMRSQTTRGHCGVAIGDGVAPTFTSLVLRPLNEN